MFTKLKEHDFSATLLPKNTVLNLNNFFFFPEKNEHWKNISNITIPDRQKKWRKKMERDSISVGYIIVAINANKVIIVRDFDNLSFVYIKREHQLACLAYVCFFIPNNNRLSECLPFAAL